MTVKATRKSVIKAVMEGKKLVKITAEDVMTKKAVTADVDTPVSDIITIMKEKNIIRLPITADSKLVGVVARCDILRSLIEPEFASYW